MLRAIRRLLGGSVSTDYLGKNLMELILGEEHGGVLKVLSEKTGKSEYDVAVALTSLYLFCYKVVTQRNSFPFKRLMIDSTYNSLAYHLVDNDIEKYSIKESLSLLLAKRNSKADIYIYLYNQQDKIDFKEVIEEFYKELGIVENQQDGDTTVLLLELIYSTVTVIQDYLVDLAIKSMVVNNHKKINYGKVGNSLSF
ncbi:MAG: hypothetical protein ACOCQW_04100 [Halanaerobiaceae bacterium]